MKAIFLSFSMAMLLTSGFALRLRMWNRRRILVVYFLFFFALEWMVETWLLPPDVFGPELGVLCLVLASVLIGLIRFVARQEREHAAERETQSSASDNSE